MPPFTPEIVSALTRNPVQNDIHSPSERTLTFSSPTFDAIDMLVEAISSSRLSFCALSITHTKFRKDTKMEKLTLLLDCLSSKLHSALLWNNVWSPSHCATVLSQLRSMSSLQSLSIHVSDEFDDSCLNILSTWIADENCSLNRLSLRWNTFHFSEKEFTQFCQSLAKNRSLFHFGLCLPNTEHMFELLTHSLSQCAFLTSLSFKSTALLKKKAIHLPCHKSKLQLEELDLRMCNINPESFPLVASFIISLGNTIKTIKLSRNTIIVDQSVGSFVSDIILGCSVLECLHLYEHTNTEPDFILDLEAALESTRSLQVLSLPALSLKSAESLKRGLQKNQSLVALFVPFSNLSKDLRLLLDFFQFLEVNEVLQALRIDSPGSSPISYDFFPSVKKLLVNNHSFCELVVRTHGSPPYYIRMKENFLRFKFSIHAPLIKFMKDHSFEWPLLDFQPTLSGILQFFSFPELKPETREDFWDWDLAF
jgi:hypothetical protein